MSEVNELDPPFWGSWFLALVLASKNKQNVVSNVSGEKNNTGSHEYMVPFQGYARRPIHAPGILVLRFSSAARASNRLLSWYSIL